MDAVDQDRDAEREVGGSLAACFLPEPSHRVRSLAERVMVRRAGMPAVAQAGDSAERGFAAAADVERGPWLLERHRREDDVLHAMALGLDLRMLLCPQGAHALEGLVAPARALLERHAEGVELALEPADRGADDQPTAGQDVDARQELRHRDR